MIENVLKDTARITTVTGTSSHTVDYGIERVYAVPSIDDIGIEADGSLKSLGPDSERDLAIPDTVTVRPGETVSVVQRFVAEAHPLCGGYLTSTVPLKVDGRMREYPLAMGVEIEIAR